MVVPLRLWQVDASSTGDEETIAIGSTMTWDENEGLPPEDEEVDDERPKGNKKAAKAESQDGPDSEQNDMPPDSMEDEPDDGPEADGQEGDGPEGDGPEGDGPETDGPEGDGPEGDDPKVDVTDKQKDVDSDKKAQQTDGDNVRSDSKKD